MGNICSFVFHRNVNNNTRICKRYLMTKKRIIGIILLTLIIVVAILLVWYTIGFAGLLSVFIYGIALGGAWALLALSIHLILGD